MAAIRQIQSSFNGGELSARLEGRTDADGIYDRGLKEMYNFVPTIEGPANKRPGTRYIKAALESATWLTPFVFNVTQAYVLEWGEAVIRFYTNGGRIETAPDVAYEVAVPYTAAEAPRISQVQSYDRRYLAHGSHPPAALTRTGAETFGYAALAFRGGPFKDQNQDRTITITASATSGSVTLTAASAIFLAGHVGAPFLIEAADFSSIPAWEVGIDGVLVGDKRRSDGKVYVAATAGRTGTVQPTHSEGTESDGSLTGTDPSGFGPYGVKWTYLHDRFGVGTITAVASGTSATLSVTRRLPDSLTSVASWRWSHGAFSAAEGWPHLVCIWAGRLIWFKGVQMFASVAGDYLNHSPFTDSGLFAPDMAFRRTLDCADPPLWVKADDQLLVGTASAEMLIGQINASAPIAGDNIKAPQQSNYGSAEVWPVDIGTGVIFAQRGRRKLREAAYEFERDRFVGINLTVWARHVTRSGTVQLAYQQEPEEMLWGVRSDGILFAHAHSPEQQVKGFGRVALANGDALARSIVSIPSEDGDRDELWLLAELDGEKAVLQMAEWWEEDDELDDDEKLAQLKAAFYVDFGVSYESDTAQSEFSEGLEHLVGRQVRILADGGVCPSQVVADAEPRITIPYAAYQVHIGLGYQARLKPMRPEARGIASLQGIRKRVVRMILRLIDTGAAIVRDNRGDTSRLLDRPGSSTMNRPIPLFSGDTPNTSAGGGYDRDGQPVIISDDPLPCIVSAAILQLEVEP